MFHPNPRRAIRNLWNSLRSGDIAKDSPLLLAYHSISRDRTDTLCVSESNFRYQLQWLQDNGYQSATLRDYTNGKTNHKKTVVLTFDDGYEDNYKVAFPLLREFGMTATVFLVSDTVSTDHIFHWDKSKIPAQGEHEHFGILTWEQIHEMREYGIEFGSHTCTHRILSELSLDEQRREIQQSKITLEKSLNELVTSFCYPEGKLKPETINLVKESGYQAGVLTPSGKGEPRGPFTHRRVGVYFHLTPWKFRIKVHPLARHLKEPLQEIRLGLNRS